MAETDSIPRGRRMSKRDLSPLVGEKAHRLLVERVIEVERGPRKLLCLCDCGSRTEVSEYNFGVTKSCGCYWYERVSAPKKHGHTCNGTVPPEYICWEQIKDRCRNPKIESYKHYGARGIDVCEEWASDYGAFFAAVGERPSPKHSIERLDYNRGYEPGNVVWATATQQARNRRSNHRIAFQGATRCLAEWEEVTGISQKVLYRRAVLGWPVDQILTKPVRVLRPRKKRHES